MKFCTNLIVVLFCFLTAVNQSNADSDEVRIVRDTFGIPHIYADDTFGLFYGYGYAVAQDRLFQMEMVKRTTSGRVAEVLGKKYLEVDRLVRQGFDPKSMKKQILNLKPDQIVPFEAYAAGINQWIIEVNLNPQHLMPKEFIDFDFKPTVWSAYDVFLVIAGSMAHRYADFNEEINNLAFLESLVRQHGREKAWKIFNATLPIYDESSPATVPDSNAQKRDSGYEGDKPPAYMNKILEGNPNIQARIAFDSVGRIKLFDNDEEKQKYMRSAFAASGIPGIAGFSSASNIWVLAPEKSSQAHGILVNGPQFGWINPSYVYGVGLHGAGFEVVGNTLFAYPFMLFAHNGQISWGSTAGFGDLVDIFVSGLNPENPDEYWYEGEYRSMEKRFVRIPVKGEESQEVTFYRTHYGPVVLTDREAGRIYSKKRSWEGKEVETSVAWVELARTQDFKSWRSKLGKMSTNINFYYLDKTGNIGYTHTGRYPIRRNGHDNRLPAPGDGSLDWKSYLPFEENPYVYNPDQAYIANWNNRPERGWRNSDNWWRRWGKAERVDILIEELESKKMFTDKEAWEINSRSSFADVNIRYLLPTLEKSITGKGFSTQIKAALRVLQQWDGYWWDKNDDGRFDGAAPLIMQHWLTRLSAQVLRDDIGDEYFFRFSSPGYPVKPIRASIPVSAGIKTVVNTLHQIQNELEIDYDFFNGESPEKVVRAAFIASIYDIVKTYGKDMKKWRLKSQSQILSAYNFRGVAQATEDNELAFPVIMNRGTENNLFVADGESIRGWDVFAPGQSGFIAPDGSKSKHYADQMELYWQFRNKFLPFSRSQVENMYESETVLRVVK